MNRSAATTRSGSALRHRWIALQKHDGGGNANDLGSPATSSPASGRNISSPRKKTKRKHTLTSSPASGSNVGSPHKKTKREHTSLTYDEVVAKLNLDATELCAHLFEVLGATPASSDTIGLATWTAALSSANYLSLCMVHVYMKDAASCCSSCAHTVLMSTKMLGLIAAIVRKKRSKCCVRMFASFGSEWREQRIYFIWAPSVVVFRRSMQRSDRRTSN